MLPPATHGNMQIEFMTEPDAFNAAPFTSGPISMSRSVFAQLQKHASEYCRTDEYNWDWSIVHSAGKGHVPHTMLYPGKERVHAIDDLHDFESGFKGTTVCIADVAPIKHEKGFGGWGHPRDQEHCMELWTK